MVTVNVVIGCGGVIGVDAADGADVPTAFLAVTVIVYAVPLVRPVRVTEVLLLVPVMPPGIAVAV